MLSLPLRCDPNSYSDETGFNKKSCKLCPSGKIIEDETDEFKHVSVDKCYKIGGVQPCDSGNGRLGSDGDCSACMAGQYSSKNRCLLCPKGFYNDQVKQDECKVCDAAGGEEVCAAVPGATSQTRGATLPEDYLFVTNSSLSSIDAVIVTDLDDRETKIGKKDEKMKGSTKYAWYFSLSIPPLSIVILHRYLPLWFKNLDLLFAGSNFIENTVSFFWLIFCSVCFSALDLATSRHSLWFTLIFFLIFFFPFPLLLSSSPPLPCTPPHLLTLSFSALAPHDGLTSWSSIDPVHGVHCCHSRHLCLF